MLDSFVAERLAYEPKSSLRETLASAVRPVVDVYLDILKTDPNPIPVVKDIGIFTDFEKEVEKAILKETGVPLKVIVFNETKPLQKQKLFDNGAYTVTPIGVDDTTVYTEKTLFKHAIQNATLFYQVTQDKKPGKLKLTAEQRNIIKAHGYSIYIPVNCFLWQAYGEIHKTTPANVTDILLHEVGHTVVSLLYSDTISLVSRFLEDTMNIVSVSKSEKECLEFLDFMEDRLDNECRKLLKKQLDALKWVDSSKERLTRLQHLTQACIIVYGRRLGKAYAVTYQKSVEREADRFANHHGASLARTHGGYSELIPIILPGDIGKAKQRFHVLEAKTSEYPSFKERTKDEIQTLEAIYMTAAPKDKAFVKKEILDLRKLYKDQDMLEKQLKEVHPFRRALQLLSNPSAYFWHDPSREYEKPHGDQNTPPVTELVKQLQALPGSIAI